MKLPELHTDELHRRLYATDASIFRELPAGVAYPRGAEDIQALVEYARERGLSLIPRTAGTSLAGQCVGSGIVVDVSRYMTRILEIHPEERWVRVEPGVIRDELNAALKPYGLFFAPNTSTANRCMIGGMVGNNSCGTTSLVYGSTRDHLLALHTVLSDGSEAYFHALTPQQFADKCLSDRLEGRLYRHIRDALSRPEVQAEIRAQYPRPEIHRRNTGYAVDLLLRSNIFTPGGPDFNFCQMLAGSEGTLAISTEITLNVVPLPEPCDMVLCAHFADMQECLRAVVLAVQHRPTACELMDHLILGCARANREQARNSFFIEGEPAAVLMIEFRGSTPDEAQHKAQALIADLRAQGFGYAYPIVPAPQSKRVWELRNAGLGVLSNMPGAAKGIPCIEDTAVAVTDLPAYIAEFEELMARFGQKSVYYAHAGDGELHLRPILNLKKTEDRQRLREIGEAMAHLVKKYGGSLSGEHGDGRVRAEFIPIVLGQKNYELLRDIKRTWDPDGLFNPGKIVDAPPMNTSLRYEADQPDRPFDTVLEFPDGILRAAEKCNGSGDCRRLDFAGGTMCPSYRATRDEKDSTRARANALREFLTRSPRPNPFSHEELYEVMDLCLSCKACASECPSNVDMAAMKAEFLHQYYKTHGIPWRARAFAHIADLYRVGSVAPGLANFLLRSSLTAPILKRLLGIAPERTMPAMGRATLLQWYSHLGRSQSSGPEKGLVYLFCDEFTNYTDVEVGIATIQLLRGLGYRVELVEHPESGRAAISKGLLLRARDLAVRQVSLFENLICEQTPLIGIEPSALLTFRDEYPRLVPPHLRPAAQRLSDNAFLLEEFLYREAQKGNIGPDDFTDEPRQVWLHGHCHQKALASIEPTAWMLGLPRGYAVSVIPSGCCGMAGSFGYEREHYEVSMRIGELVLLPAVRALPPDAILAVPGTSCRHQILDGTGRIALHPAQVLAEALVSKKIQ
ncbi:MAG: FAD-linked oxidase C-terminal domain-containing protein [Saprospiraceae bacterium]|nr:FAD-binding protein [Saprospiraceae bacterium]MDW8230865.1 FAD-linked oxidase C-terminal domain-containing protein [Saprospiraceae bacterium]